MNTNQVWAMLESRYRKPMKDKPQTIPGVFYITGEPLRLDDLGVFCDRTEGQNEKRPLSGANST